MKPLIPFIKEAAALCILFALITAGSLHLYASLNETSFFSYLTHPCVICAVLLALQLVAMKWSGSMLNLLLLIFTILSCAVLMALTLGLDVAITEAVQQSLQEESIQLPTDKLAAQYKLIPIAWFIALLSAPAQLRATSTGAICYFVWLAVTAALLNNTDMWAGTDNALAQQLSELFTNTSWMNAAVPGLFLLFFAITFELLCSLLPGKRKEAPLPPLPPFSSKS